MCKHRPSTSGLGQPRHTNSELWQPHGRSASKADDARSLRKLVGHADHPHQPRRMTMDNQGQTNPSKPRVEPWNKGKLIGQKPPLRPKHVWSIRTRLQMDGRVRDLAMFNLAIDSKLRGCDVVALRVEALRPAGMRSIALQCGRRRPGGPSGLS